MPTHIDYKSAKLQLINYNHVVVNFVHNRIKIQISANCSAMKRDHTQLSRLQYFFNFSTTIPQHTHKHTLLNKCPPH